MQLIDKKIINKLNHTYNTTKCQLELYKDTVRAMASAEARCRLIIASVAL